MMSVLVEYLVEQLAMLLRNAGDAEKLAAQQRLAMLIGLEYADSAAADAIIRATSDYPPTSGRLR